LSDVNSGNYWYLSGDPRNAISMIFLNGVQAPVLEETTVRDYDGVSYIGRMDVVAKALSWQALFRGQNS